MSKHENSNQFKDGLLMDLHPLQTPNTVLTDCLNGTFITYNGNEYSLQNDMGNFKLKNCRLEPKYFPIGTTSYADTIYIVSYNPVDKKVQIGSYPSPVQYNETSSRSACKFYGITEAFIRNSFGDAESNNTKITNGSYLIMPSKFIKDYSSKYRFEGDLFRLKGGDEYILNRDQWVHNYFEDLVTSVVFDSGKSQIVNATWNPGIYKPIPWNTPGYLEITSKMVDFDRCEIDLLGEEYRKQNILDESGKKHSQNICISTFKADVYVTDEQFVNKIKARDYKTLFTSDYYKNKDKAKDKAKQSDLTEVVFIDVKLSDNSTYDVKFSKCSKWMTDGLKIQFLITVTTIFEEPESEGQLPRKSFDLTVTPYVTSQTYFSSDNGEDKESWKLYVRTEYSTKSATINHVVDLSKSPFENIANKIFKWTNDTIIFNGNKFEENVGKMQYAMIKVSDKKPEYNDPTIRWIDCDKWEDGMYTITYDPGEDDFYYFFIRAISVKYDTDENNQTVVVDGEYDSDNAEIVNKIVLVINSVNWEDYDQYDIYTNIPIQDIIQKCFDEEISNTEKMFEDGSNLSKELGKRSDFVGSEKSNLAKYFERFADDSEFDFKSFVKKSETPNTTETLFTYKTFKYTPDCKKHSTSSLFKNFEQKVKCNNGVEAPFYIKDRFNAFGGFLATVNTGKSFLFVDKLKYYQLKARSIDDNSRFFVTNIDKSGKSSNEYFIPVYFWNNESLGSGTADHTAYYKSLDVNNYRAIRMFYPPIGKDDYNKKGMCQMDFGYESTGTSLLTVLLPGIGGIAAAALDSQRNMLLDGIKNINGLCQYVQNFHYNLTDELKKQWLDHKDNGYQAIAVKLAAKTFYRDKAQRATFTNDNFSVDISPSWEKFTDDRVPSSVDAEDRGVTASQNFLAFPIWDPETQSPKMLEHTIDREFWWAISGSEQHNNPEITGNGKVEGIGLVKCNWGGDDVEFRDLYVAWVPGESDARFTEYAYGSIVMDAKFTDTPIVELNLVRIPDTEFVNKITTIKTQFTSEFDVPLLEMFDEIVVFKHNDSFRWDSSELSILKTNFEEICEQDKANLVDHPIFKYTIVDIPESRIQSFPVAGVYPKTKLSNNTFGPAGFNNWNHFKVDDDGRVYLQNLDVNEDIYVRKNSNKKVFGYFPYLPDCEKWI